MKKFCLLLIFSAFVTLTEAQKPPIKFGDIPLDQLKMTRYGKDSSASAVVLTDYAISTVDYNQTVGFTLNFERIKRIKILTKEGLDQANFSIELYHNNSGDDEKVSGLKAVTYNLENGKIVETKVGKDGIFMEKFDDNIDIMKLTWPNVQVGSVLEIAYKVNSDFLFNFQDWQFQEEIPVVWSEYRAQIPEYLNYEKYLQGYIGLFVNTHEAIAGSIMLTFKGEPGMGAREVSTEKLDFIKNSFRWVAKDVPAFKAEPFITTERDYISKMNFELSYTKFPDQPVKNYMGSWEDINKMYAERADFAGEVNSNNFLKKTVEEITNGITVPEEKMAAICLYVKHNIIWNGLSRRYTSSTIRKVFDDKKGNATDINLLLASMLEKAEIDVAPVLLSTRDHGFLRENTPVSTQFNYTICQAKIGEKIFLLDATEELLPVSVLPKRCLNGKGLVVSKEGFKWASLQPQKSKTIISIDLSLANTGNLKGKIQIDRNGYFALEDRKKYISKGEADYLKNFLGSHPWEITKSEFKNAKDISQSFTEIHDVSINEHVITSGDVAYMNPFIFNQMEANPFKLEKREYPVDFGHPFDNMYLIKINIPDDYTIEELPKTKVFMLPNNAAKYFYNVGAVGNTITITSNLSINSSLFTQEEYPNLREFYNQVVAKQAEQIVLKKK